MIQDIAPKQFSVAYDLHVPESGDTICLFRGSRILGARCTDGELRLPASASCRAGKRLLVSVLRFQPELFLVPPRLTPTGGDYSWVSLRRSMAFSPSARLLPP